MFRVGIWERGEGIFRAVRAAIQTGRPPYPELTCGRWLGEFSASRLDLLAVSPAAAAEKRPGGGGRCRCLLLPGEAGPLARWVSAEYAVSYGTAPRDTLTFSSLEGERMVLALQRELVTLDGSVVEQQELVLPFPAGRDPQPWLAAVGVLLLLGVPPEELMGGNG